MTFIRVSATGAVTPAIVEQHLPSNYRVVGYYPAGIFNAHRDIGIQGTDERGLTAEGYVIPRLANARIEARVEMYGALGYTISGEAADVTPDGGIAARPVRALDDDEAVQ